MNGVKYCEYVKGSEEWRAKVAASKFKAFEGFGGPTGGYIALQDHNDEVACRNIKIRVLQQSGCALGGSDRVTALAGDIIP